MVMVTVMVMSQPVKMDVKPYWVIESPIGNVLRTARRQGVNRDKVVEHRLLGEPLLWKTSKILGDKETIDELK
jgi:hypothetical protein